jgi:uncharacterized protein YbbK (DUF523 family)
MTVARSDVADSRRLRPIRIGISACLLGEPVRFDGGHKRDAFLTETFGRFVEWVPVCPEVECGFGTPREAMRLVRIEQGLRLLTVKTGIDLTEQMERFSRSCVSALVRDDLSGYVLKKDSPSCGLERVKIYDRLVSRTPFVRSSWGSDPPHFLTKTSGFVTSPRTGHRDEPQAARFNFAATSGTPEAGLACGEARILRFFQHGCMLCSARAIIRRRSLEIAAISRLYDGSFSGTPLEQDECPATTSSRPAPGLRRAHRAIRPHAASLRRRRVPADLCRLRPRTGS